MGPLPVIRMEIEHMKHSVCRMLSEYQLEMDEHLKQSLDRYCDPANIQQIMDREVKLVMDGAVREAVEDYFRHGKGRAAVLVAVTEAFEREVAE